MFFVHKPCVIDAFRWTGGPDRKDDPWWIQDAIREGIVTFCSGKLCIHTPEGVMRANSGDWIIRGVCNDLYPCKPTIFDKTYEPI